MMVLLLRWNAWMNSGRRKPSLSTAATNSTKTTTTTTATSSSANSNITEHVVLLETSWIKLFMHYWVLLFGIFHDMAGSFLVQQHEHEQQQHWTTTSTNKSTSTTGTTRGKSPPQLQRERLDEDEQDDTSCHDDDLVSIHDHSFDLDMIDPYKENL